MYQAKNFDSIYTLNGISNRTMTEHYQLYLGYVKKFNEISEKLQQADSSAANQVFSDWRSLKVEMSFALGGIKNHEIYFDQLGGKNGQPDKELLEIISRDFGSWEKFLADFKATAMASRGWAHLVYDRDLQRLLITAGDAQNTYSYWNAVPLMACDVYEHAYFIDFGVKRADYLEAYFSNLNWGKIQERYEQCQ